MRTIDDLFHHLLNTSARFSKSIALLDRRVRLYCSSRTFLDWLQETYTRTTLLKGQIDAADDDVCIIDSCLSCSGWRDLLPAEPLRVVQDPFVGYCEIYQVPDGLVLYQTEGWVVCRSTQGPIIFLHEGQLETADLNHWPNPTGLISILFSEILARSGKWLVHAAGVGHRGKCHVWTGHSGTGKTTRALAHVTEGFSFFGDDMLVLGKGDGGHWQVWPFWRPLHVTRHTCELLPFLSEVEHSFSRKNKSSVEITDLLEVTPPSAAPLESIWILATDESTATRRLDPTEAFGMLSQTFMHGFWPETTRANLEALLDIVFQIPVFIMTRSTPLSQRVDEMYSRANSEYEQAV